MPNEDPIRFLVEAAAMNSADLVNVQDACTQAVHSSMALPPSLLMGQPKVEQPGSPLHDVSLTTAITEMARYMHASIEDTLPPEYRSPIEGEYEVVPTPKKLPPPCTEE
jgi:hypothetical protein